MNATLTRRRGFTWWPPAFLGVVDDATVINRSLLWGLEWTGERLLRQDAALPVFLFGRASSAGASEVPSLPTVTTISNATDLLAGAKCTIDSGSRAGIYIASLS